MTMLELVIKVFAMLVQELTAAGEDAAAHEHALMTAQERLSRARMLVKFPPPPAPAPAPEPPPVPE